jgi:hypothetical protein
MNRIGVVFFVLMVACYCIYCCGDDYGKTRMQTWRMEKLNGLANAAAILRRTRHNARVRGEVLEEEEEAIPMDEDSDSDSQGTDIHQEGAEDEIVIDWDEDHFYKGLKTFLNQVEEGTAC